ncbi:MAG TPA: hypothetical protein VGV17_05755 [Bosea sp. (in: a-proteobacteria)]|jgi:hypothetical protein|uniref:hypothetical protein n=1 Tax=Bosea sp. (in: a-proteobacteria) TaxID=1871050 RepID=UPI002DDCB154|nr:hypothetical protein [Bosea sp. (in: a-proteobacteria)]HEV2553241.1 hypothetical protein [Bosea sp. (in: a-proteobacteria)]
MTKDELIAELQRMLISALDAADHVKRQADRRQARELNALVEAAMIARERGRTTPWMFGPGDSGRHSEPRG